MRSCLDCPDYVADQPTPEQVLIDFPHGLGDCVQLTAILRHLRRFRPDWEVDVRCGLGRPSLFAGLCRRAFHTGEAPDRDYDRVIADGFPESLTETKTLHALRHTYHLTPVVELLAYEWQPQTDDLEAARAYYHSLGLAEWSDGRYPVVVAHYKGNSVAGRKSLPDAAILPLADRCHALGLTLVVLDWDERTAPVVRYHPAVAMCTHFTAPDLWRHQGCGDAARIAALMELAVCWLGIDSGPGHVGGATTTPGVVVWTGHHPVRYYDYAMPQVLHLVPPDLDRLPPGKAGRAILDRYYRHRTYTDLPTDIAVAVLENLAHREPPAGSQTDPAPAPGAICRWGFWIPADRPSQSWTIIEDVYVRDAYKTRLRPRRTGVEYVVDVGANIGCFTRLWRERNPDAQIACVEVHPTLVPLLTANCPGATIVSSACAYSAEPLYLLDSLSDLAVSQSTGGSRVVSRAEWEAETAAEYIRRPDPLTTVTLEEVCAIAGFPRIDVLKLDCEGSEFDILEHCDLSNIHTIFVESHDPARWRDLLSRRFGVDCANNYRSLSWDVGHMSANGNCETWHLVRRF